jgi:hypothetical protein
MSFERKWKNFQRLTEAKKVYTGLPKYKDQRRKNDIYTTKSGHKNLSTGSPYVTRAKRFGTSKLHFEGMEEAIDSAALKSFEVHDTFDPEIWNGESLNSEVRENLLKIAKDFLIDLPIDLSPEDITLTGSLANYNWSKYSDIDLHILVNFTEIDDNLDLVREFFRQLQTNWNNRHDIIMKGYEVEIYFQDSSEPHISTGVYSVQNDSWLVKPTPESVSIDYENIKKKSQDISDRIDDIEKMMTDEKGDVVLDAVDRLKAKIRNMRKTGLEGAGQYSVENLAFKVLRRSEELGRLSDLKAKAYDQFMSIEQ